MSTIRAPYHRREKSFYSVQALDRAVDILDCFAEGSDLSIADVAQRIELPRATVHRLLSSLAARRLVEQDHATGRYRLGVKLFELGSLVGNRFDVKSAAAEPMASLVARGGETAHLVLLDGCDILFVDKRETSNPFRMVSEVGRRLPASCSAAGKTLLADLPDAELRRRFADVDLPALTSRSLVRLDDLLSHLAVVRARGYAVDDEETQIGLRCIGTAIRNHRGEAVAAISISGPVVRVSDERIAPFVQLLRSTADTISRHLGFRG
ncbi:MAG: IclR family transcriptional regulator [Chloroflexi bacterium]|nr:IclR family transcriptional regulator [Chloroflexota bacterium]